MNVPTMKTYLFGVLLLLSQTGVLRIHAAMDSTIGLDSDLIIHLSRAYNDGTIKVLFFDSAEAFEDFQAPVRIERFPASGEKTLRIEDVPAGEYALLVYLDENGNQRLDVNFIGIPSEPIGFSNTYRPRGKPTFRNALFTFVPGESAPIDMELARPLGERGRIGIGAGLLTRSSPYQQSTDNPVTYIPALVYIGNRVQITGPFARIGLIGSGNKRLAATLSYRQAVYEESDSVLLRGMGDRRATALGGVSYQMDTWGGIDLNLGYQHDALGRIGGGEGSLSLSRPIPSGRFRFSPSVGLHAIHRELVRHDFGVNAAEATDVRSVYRPGHALNFETGMAVFAEITPTVMGVFSASIEWFDADIRRSPIVDKDYVLKGTAFIVYML